MLCLAAMTLLAAHPIEMWLTVGRLQEDMIYRLLFCSLLGTFGMTLLSAGILCEQLHSLWDSRPRLSTFLSASLDRLYSLAGLGVVCLFALPVLTWLVGPGVWTRLSAGYVDLHWSRVVLAGLIIFGLGQMLVTVLIANLVRFHVARKLLARESVAQPPTAARAQRLDAVPVLSDGLAQPNGGYGAVKTPKNAEKSASVTRSSPS
jgi:hypothetical protein